MGSIHHPNNHPYIMYVYVKDSLPVFFLETSEENAKKVHHRAAPVMVVDLLLNFGHQQTHSFLKSFNPTPMNPMPYWTTKYGMVFYGETAILNKPAVSQTRKVLL